MEKKNITGLIVKFVLKEALAIVSCVAAAYALGRMGIVIAAIGTTHYTLKMVGMLYLATVAFRLAGFFLKMTLKVAFVLGLIGVGLLYLSAKFPEAFRFLQR